jgi:hypothetical protein
MVNFSYEMPTLNLFISKSKSPMPKIQIVSKTAYIFIFEHLIMEISPVKNSHFFKYAQKYGIKMLILILK